MEIDQKSISQLIDELVTTLIKCYMAQETLMSSVDETVVAKAARIAQQTNARRNQLMRAIDQRLGETEITPTEKSYAEELDERG